LKVEADRFVRMTLAGRLERVQEPFFYTHPGQRDRSWDEPAGSFGATDPCA
jgi:hypothetical protein